MGMLFLALGIVLGHTILPHEHRPVSQADQCIEDLKPGWVSWLSHLFHPDLGSHHLEDFADSGRLVLDAFLAPEPTVWLLGSRAVERMRVAEDPFEVIALYSPQSLSLRAPPVVS
jgi:hypothetical protein